MADFTEGERVEGAPVRLQASGSARLCAKRWLKQGVVSRDCEDSVHVDIGAATYGIVQQPCCSSFLSHALMEAASASSWRRVEFVATVMRAFISVHFRHVVEARPVAICNQSELSFNLMMRRDCRLIFSFQPPLFCAWRHLLPGLPSSPGRCSIAAEM